MKERDCSQGKEGPPRRKLACHPGQVELAKAGRLARPRADVKRVGNINWISWLPSMRSQGVDLTVARPTFFVSWRLIRRKFVLQRFILTTVH